MLYLRQVLTAVAALLVASTIAWADTYTIASFSGAINGGSANVKPPFSGNGFTQGDSISGSFVFDNQLVPPPASGFRNVFFSTFPDIAAIPPALQRFACARLSQSCLSKSCSDFSATFTTIAFDDSSLRWLEIST